MAEVNRYPLLTQFKGGKIPNIYLRTRVLPPRGIGELEATIDGAGSFPQEQLLHGPLGFMAAPPITLPRRQNGVVPVPSRGHSPT